MMIGFWEKYNNGRLSLKDQDYVLKNESSAMAWRFASLVPGANIEKLQEIACKNPIGAYDFFRNVKGANIKKCFYGVCNILNKDPNNYSNILFVINYIEESGINQKWAFKEAFGDGWEKEYNTYIMKKACE